MGNCMECYTQKQQEDIKEPEKEEKEGGIRVKIVLRKDELELLMFQLNEKGGKGLEDVLREIEKSREKLEEDEVKYWKPSLESIMEGPEVHEMDRS
ncbi:hypothetical protein ACHQM5_012013 [Ranunculus cassubicifolius]